MKQLNQFLIKALALYKGDANSAFKKVTQEQSMKGIKLGHRQQLQEFIQQYEEKEYLEKQDCNAIKEKIENIQSELSKERTARDIEGGWFELILDWIYERAHQWGEQLDVMMQTEKEQQGDQHLSPAQYCLLHKIGEFIVLLNGFSSFPDNRSFVSSWVQGHPRTLIYEEQEWNEKSLTPEKIQTLISNLLEFKTKTVAWIQGLNENQLQISFYYMATELKSLHPVCQSLATLLEQKFGAKSLLQNTVAPPTESDQPESVFDVEWGEMTGVEAADNEVKQPSSPITIKHAPKQQSESSINNNFEISGTSPLQKFNVMKFSPPPIGFVYGINKNPEVKKVNLSTGGTTASKPKGSAKKL